MAVFVATFVLQRRCSFGFTAVITAGTAVSTLTCREWKQLADDKRLTMFLFPHLASQRTATLSDDGILLYLPTNQAPNMEPRTLAMSVSSAKGFEVNAFTLLRGFTLYLKVIATCWPLTSWHTWGTTSLAGNKLLEWIHSQQNRLGRGIRQQGEQRHESLNMASTAWSTMLSSMTPLSLTTLANVPATVRTSFSPWGLMYTTSLSSPSSSQGSDPSGRARAAPVAGGKWTRAKTRCANRFVFVCFQLWEPDGISSKDPTLKPHNSPAETWQSLSDLFTSQIEQSFAMDIVKLVSR